MPKRGSLARGVVVKRLQLAGNLLPGETRRVLLGSAAIPRNTAPGTYYLAYVLKDPKDTYPANNRAWSLEETALTVTR